MVNGVSVPVRGFSVLLRRWHDVRRLCRRVWNVSVPVRGFSVLLRCNAAFQNDRPQIVSVPVRGFSVLLQIKRGEYAHTDCMFQSP